MIEILEVILGVFFLAAVFVLTRYIMVWRLRRAASYIFRQLERRQAFGARSAVELPYLQKGFFQIGIRDYRPKALESMIQGGIVGTAENGRYYLKKDAQNVSV